MTARLEYGTYLIMYRISTESNSSCQIEIDDIHSMVPDAN